ncbi:hypothetical protein [Noviherbaspirillum massiliense]|uniref:hypothetical protein n=1 Tax=Noviherbaspirillum massiliense TaxID=1465823 RepID=UPI000307D9AA|nr:hypothetical protein [Noviherbaspirillum massiliense]
MSQQINLFNPIFLKQKKYFSATTMAQALGMILAGALLLGAYTSYQVSALSKEVEATSAQLASTQAQLTSLNAQFGKRQRNQQLEQDVQKAEAEIRSMQQALDTLRRGDLGNTKGYAEYMRAFARQIVGGVWLTGFGISGAGSEIGLQGRALKPDLVPVYISRLKHEPALQGKSFASLEVHAPRVETAGKDDSPAAKHHVNGAYVEFNLQSSGTAGMQAAAPGAKSK